MSPRTIAIGYDPREDEAYHVAYETACACSNAKVLTIRLDDVREQGLYHRQHEQRDGRMYDVISDAPMSTEFAITRFLAPELARRSQGPDHSGKRGWVLFMDCDVLVRKKLDALFNYVEQNSDHFALFCVQHHYAPPEGVKMDGQMQVRYARKNWSSVMAINLDHDSNRMLTLPRINKLPGRDLHRFCWLDNHEIGKLDTRWNWLVGHSASDIDPWIVHFTEGGPWLPAYQNVPYAEEWRQKRDALAQARSNILTGLVPAA